MTNKRTRKGNRTNCKRIRERQRTKENRKIPEAGRRHKQAVLERKELEANHQQTENQRYKQTQIERQMEDNRNQAKLMEAEARNAKLITDGIENQQRIQQQHNLHLQL